MVFSNNAFFIYVMFHPIKTDLWSTHVRGSGLTTTSVQLVRIVTVYRYSKQITSWEKTNDQLTNDCALVLGKPATKKSEPGYFSMHSPYFRTFGKSCLECTYIPKCNYALGEESGFFSSNTKGPAHLAGAFFMNTL